MDALMSLLLVSHIFLSDELLPTNRVEVLEINHYYDGEGKHIFDQALIRKFSPAYDPKRTWRNNVTCWKIIGGQDMPWRVMKQHPYGPWYLYFHDRNGTTHRIFRIVANDFYETWTQYDADIVERSIFPQEDRTGVFAVDSFKDGLYHKVQPRSWTWPPEMEYR